MTPAGQVDRDALPQPPATAVTGQDRTPPRTPAEEAIAAVWAEVLGLAELDVNADFFALGGHSLKAMMVASRLRVVFDCPIKFRAIFENPTVASLAAVVEQLLVEQIAAMTEEEILDSLNIDPGHDG
jgi:acyl carrier protein